MTEQSICAIYCRFSSKAQEKGFSIEAQKSACLEYAKKQNFKVYRIFEDRAMSGTTDERDAFQQMISLATDTPPPFTAILVHNLNRFARNRYDSIKYKYLLRKNNVKVISVSQPFLGSNDPTEVLLESMLEGMDEFYSLNLARESIKGMVENVKAGFWNGGFAPYGFRIKKVTFKDRERSKLEIEPKESKIVKYIYARYASGNIGMSALTSELNRKRMKPRTGDYFTKNHIANILTNEKYVGDSIFGKELNTGNRPFKPLPEPILVKNSHPAIITREQAEKVQKVLKRHNPENNPPRIHNDSYLLSSLIICGKCGGRYVGASAKGGKFHYYMCNVKSRKGKKACDAPEFNRDWIETKVVEEIKQNLITKKNIRKLAIDLFNMAKERAVETPKKIGQFESEARTKEKKLQRLYEIIETSHELNMDDFAPRIRELKADIQQLREQKERLEEEYKKTSKAVFNERFIADYVQLLIDILDSEEFYRRKIFVADLIKEIRVKDGKCRVSYTPFAAGLGFLKDSEIDLSSRPTQKKNSGVNHKPEFSQKRNWLPL